MKLRDAISEKTGIDMDYEDARERVYGMPYAQWKSRHQSEASPEQIERFQDARP